MSAQDNGMPFQDLIGFLPVSTHFLHMRVRPHLHAAPAPPPAARSTSRRRPVTRACLPAARCSLARTRCGVPRVSASPVCTPAHFANGTLPASAAGPPPACPDARSPRGHGWTAGFRARRNCTGRMAQPLAGVWPRRVLHAHAHARTRTHTRTHTHTCTHAYTHTRTHTHANTHTHTHCTRAHLATFICAP